MVKLLIETLMNQDIAMQKVVTQEMGLFQRVVVNMTQLQIEKVQVVQAR